MTPTILSHLPTVVIEASSADYSPHWKIQTTLHDAVDNNVRNGLLVDKGPHRWVKFKFERPYIIYFFLIAMWSKESFEIEVGNNPVVGDNPSCKTIPTRYSNEEFIKKYYRCNDRRRWTGQYVVIKSQERFHLWEIQVYGEKVA